MGGGVKTSKSRKDDWKCCKFYWSQGVIARLKQQRGVNSNEGLHKRHRQKSQQSMDHLSEGGDSGIPWDRPSCGQRASTKICDTPNLRTETLGEMGRLFLRFRSGAGVCPWQRGKYRLVGTSTMVKTSWGPRENERSRHTPTSLFSASGLTTLEGGGVLKIETDNQTFGGRRACYKKPLSLTYMSGPDERS